MRPQEELRAASSRSKAQTPDVGQDFHMWGLHRWRGVPEKYPGDSGMGLQLIERLVGWDCDWEEGAIHDYPYLLVETATLFLGACGKQGYQVVHWAGSGTDALAWLAQRGERRGMWATGMMHYGGSSGGCVWTCVSATVHDR